MANPVINGNPQPVQLTVYRGQGTNGTQQAQSQNLYTPPYYDSYGYYFSGQYVVFNVLEYWNKSTINITWEKKIQIWDVTLDK